MKSLKSADRCCCKVFQKNWQLQPAFWACRCVWNIWCWVFEQTENRTQILGKYSSCLRRSLITFGGGLRMLWPSCKACFCVAPVRRCVEPKLKTPEPTKFGDTWTSLKKAWCSTQHFQRCLQACLDGVSNPYVLSSFWNDQFPMKVFDLGTFKIFLRFCPGLAAWRTVLWS